MFVNRIVCRQNCLSPKLFVSIIVCCQNCLSSKLFVVKVVCCQSCLLPEYFVVKIVFHQSCLLLEFFVVSFGILSHLINTNSELCRKDFILHCSVVSEYACIFGNTIKLINFFYPTSVVLHLAKQRNSKLMIFLNTQKYADCSRLSVGMLCIRDVCQYTLLRMSSYTEMFEVC